MKTRRARRRFCVAVVLCTAACACVVQTAEAVGTGNACLAPALAQEASAFDSAVYETTAFGAATQTRLADIGKQVLDPEHYAHPLSVPANPQAKTLPAVPTAVVLTLFGFICVSITRDRRAWLALAAGILWLGQAGIQTLPQLAPRIRTPIAKANAGNKCLCFIETAKPELAGSRHHTAYAGLLHKLAAIPDSPASFISNSNAKARTPALATGGQCLAYATAADGLWQDTANECPASATGQAVCFSPAFTFQNLARGPPALFP